MSTLTDEIARRRTFAIISHPDAGKTTLTEKLLLFGGAIQLAGEVRARGERRRARSDWMAIERERGISVSSAVMSFEHEGLAFNLLDTPGHQDFSEDTYRTLTAVDSAVMVLDAAKGIEEQTRKLFEVCRLRDVPIITFVNKLDREGRARTIRARPPRPGHRAGPLQRPRRPRACSPSAQTGTRQAARGGRDGKGALPTLRSAGLSRRPSDPGLFWQCAQ